MMTLSTYGYLLATPPVPSETVLSVSSRPNTWPVFPLLFLFLDETRELAR